jgi:hypothetical protein
MTDNELIPAARLSNSPLLPLRDWVHRYNAEGDSWPNIPAGRQSTIGADGTADGGTERPGYRRSRSGDPSRRSLALRGSPRGDRTPLVRHLARAHRWQTASPSRIDGKERSSAYGRRKAVVPQCMPLRRRGVRDNRHDSAHLFGAICPERGVGAAIIMPAVNTEAMNEHLKEISAQVARGAHALLVCAGAGWHQRGERLIVPDNITLLHRPTHRN